jgi:flavin-dependent dehydrogenase
MCDVAIVGGGPAGCAAALSLRTHAPDLSVTLVEASLYDRPRIGETLTPAATRVLRHLGVVDAFNAQPHLAAHGTSAAWGAYTPHDNDFIFAARGSGWHLDRRAFDAMLAEQAHARGTTVHLGTRLTGATRASDPIWILHLSNGAALHARFVIDATGPAAAFARRAGARPRTSDRMVAFVRFFSAGDDALCKGRTLVEAFRDGWWYTAPLPGGLRIAACMTDRDIGARLSLATPAGWRSALHATTHVRAALQNSQGASPLLVRKTPSRQLSPACGPGWLAAGDAASIFDPLSSQGILKALRCGTFASYVAADTILRADTDALARYQRFVAAEFAAYARMHERYYNEERRWPDSDFWLRRQNSYAHIDGIQAVN